MKQMRYLIITCSFLLLQTTNILQARTLTIKNTAKQKADIKQIITEERQADIKQIITEEQRDLFGHPITSEQRANASTTTKAGAQAVVDIQPIEAGETVVLNNATPNPIMFQFNYAGKKPVVFLIIGAGNLCLEVNDKIFSYCPVSIPPYKKPEISQEEKERRAYQQEQRDIMAGYR